MGRRNENNRLAHKKKVDNQKKKQLEALAARKEKLKNIHLQFAQQLLKKDTNT